MFYEKRFVNPTTENPIGSWKRVVNKDLVFVLGVSVAILVVAIAVIIN